MAIFALLCVACEYIDRSLLGSTDYRTSPPFSEDIGYESHFQYFVDLRFGRVCLGVSACLIVQDPEVPQPSNTRDGPSHQRARRARYRCSLHGPSLYLAFAACFQILLGQKMVEFVTLFRSSLTLIRALGDFDFMRIVDFCGTNHLPAGSSSSSSSSPSSSSSCRHPFWRRTSTRSRRLERSAADVDEVMMSWNRLVLQSAMGGAVERGREGERGARLKVSIPVQWQDEGLLRVMKRRRTMSW